MIQDNEPFVIQPPAVDRSGDQQNANYHPAGHVEPGETSELVADIKNDINKENEMIKKDIKRTQEILDAKDSTPVKNENISFQNALDTITADLKTQMTKGSEGADEFVSVLKKLTEQEQFNGLFFGKDPAELATDLPSSLDQAEENTQPKYLQYFNEVQDKLETIVNNNQDIANEPLVEFQDPNDGTVAPSFGLATMDDKGSIYDLETFSEVQQGIATRYTQMITKVTRLLINSFTETQIAIEQQDANQVAVAYQAFVTEIVKSMSNPVGFEITNDIIATAEYPTVDELSTFIEVKPIDGVLPDEVISSNQLLGARSTIDTLSADMGSLAIIFPRFYDKESECPLPFTNIPPTELYKENPVNTVMPAMSLRAMAMVSVSAKQLYINTPLEYGITPKLLIETIRNTKERILETDKMMLMSKESIIVGLKAIASISLKLQESDENIQRHALLIIQSYLKLVSTLFKLVFSVDRILFNLADTTVEYMLYYMNAFVLYSKKAHQPALQSDLHQSDLITDPDGAKAYTLTNVESLLKGLSVVRKSNYAKDIVTGHKVQMGKAMVDDASGVIRSFDGMQLLGEEYYQSAYACLVNYLEYVIRSENTPVENVKHEDRIKKVNRDVLLASREIGYIVDKCENVIDVSNDGTDYFYANSEQTQWIFHYLCHQEHPGDTLYFDELKKTCQDLDEFSLALTKIAVDIINRYSQTQTKLSSYLSLYKESLERISLVAETFLNEKSSSAKDVILRGKGNGLSSLSMFIKDVFGSQYVLGNAGIEVNGRSISICGNKCTSSIEKVKADTLANLNASIVNNPDMPYDSYGQYQFEDRLGERQDIVREHIIWMRNMLRTRLGVDSSKNMMLSNPEDTIENFKIYKATSWLLDLPEVLKKLHWFNRVATGALAESVLLKLNACGYAVKDEDGVRNIVKQGTSTVNASRSIMTLLSSEVTPEVIDEQSDMQKDENVERFKALFSSLIPVITGLATPGGDFDFMACLKENIWEDLQNKNSQAIEKYSYLVESNPQERKPYSLISEETFKAINILGIVNAETVLHGISNLNKLMEEAILPASARADEDAIAFINGFPNIDFDRKFVNDFFLKLDNIGQLMGTPQIPDMENIPEGFNVAKSVRLLGNKAIYVGYDPIAYKGEPAQEAKSIEESFFQIERFAQLEKDQIYNEETPTLDLPSMRAILGKTMDLLDTLRSYSNNAASAYANYEERLGTLVTQVDQIDSLPYEQVIELLNYTALLACLLKYVVEMKTKIMPYVADTIAGVLDYVLSSASD